MFLSLAYAQAAAAPAADPNPVLQFVPFIFIFVVMYFLILRPQSKRQKDHQKFLTELKRGDEVLTSGGLLGRIEGMTEQFVTLEISDGVRVKMLRNQVASLSRTATEGKA